VRCAVALIKADADVMAFYSAHERSRGAASLTGARQQQVFQEERRQFRPVAQA
jgi:hypothetical protein